MFRSVPLETLDDAHHHASHSKFAKAVHEHCHILKMEVYAKLNL